jgi:hypothetical protein
MCLLVLAGVTLPREVHAQTYTFDWTGRTFTGLSTTYTNVNGSGVDVTVTLSGNTYRLLSGYPTVTSAFEIDRALDIFAN